MKRKIKWSITAIILLVFILTAYFFLNRRGQTDIFVDESIPRISVASSAFENLGTIPDKYTGRGEDISPDIELLELMESATSIAIIMDDLDVPWKSNFTHWVVWNIPATAYISEGLLGIDDAVQGVAFGQNRYRGPMPPFGTHRYQFHVFVLDSTLNLNRSCGKSDLLNAMDGHILQYGTLTGWYPHEVN